MNRTLRSPASHANPRDGRMRGVITVVFLLAAIAIVYCPPPGSGTLLGTDFLGLHLRRIQYARDALFGPNHYLPGWYSREMLGAPFWSNIQSFPLIPTRLVLLAFDPFQAYAIGVEIAACLSALLTYLYCRKIGLGRIAAASGGFTFACAGFFASRILVGHLPLLEAYPALPLLLLLVERCVAAGCARGWSLIALGSATAFIALAGHPQIPAYAMITAVIYAFYRMPNMRGVRTVSAIVLGFGCSAFALWPFVALLRQSTRYLPLNAATNDISLPYGRLKAFLFPWADGCPSIVNHFHTSVFSGYPSDCYFWDTVCYVGWMPILALFACGIGILIRRQRLTSPWPFIAIIGLFSLLLALPFMQHFGIPSHVTFFRSNARQLYVTSYCLAIIFAGGINILLGLRPSFALSQKIINCIVGLGIAFHVCDLWIHDRPFIKLIRVDRWRFASESDRLKREVGNGRMAAGLAPIFPPNLHIDNVSFFDSVLLAKPYISLLETAGMDAADNIELLNGTHLEQRFLEFAGVRSVALEHESSHGLSLELQTVRHPSRRVEFFPSTRIQYLTPAQMHKKLRDSHTDLQAILMVPAGEAKQIGNISTSFSYNQTDEPTEVPESLTPDEMAVNFTADRPGYLRFLEAWNPGWHASVNGQPKNIIVADDTFMAIALSPGSHTVRLNFSTPGKLQGLLMSVTSAALLILLAFWKRDQVVNDNN